MSEYIIAHCVDSVSGVRYDERREEIVRCRDCSRTDNCCFIYEYGYEPNGFCSWGEKKGSLENGIQ